MPAFKISTLCLALLTACTITTAPATERPDVIPFPAGKPRLVSNKTMREIHAQVQTPHKYGVVLAGAPGELLDCPNVFRHGGRWYMMFVANQDNAGYETHLAVSDDLRTWRRLGHGPVVANVGASPWAISGDPQLVKMGDVWVMFYFGAFWKPGAFDTFAASYDLVHWTKWDGPHLVEPGEPWDRQFAHKPWVLKHDGVVYHFYCAVGDRGRVIALATSKDLRPKE
jgi:predicted GH43/DUF377 family glycosyl hydrolase